MCKSPIPSPTHSIAHPRATQIATPPLFRVPTSAFRARRVARRQTSISETPRATARPHQTLNQAAIPALRARTAMAAPEIPRRARTRSIDDAWDDHAGLPSNAKQRPKIESSQTPANSKFSPFQLFIDRLRSNPTPFLPLESVRQFSCGPWAGRRVILLHARPSHACFRPVVSRFDRSPNRIRRGHRPPRPPLRPSVPSSLRPCSSHHTTDIPQPPPSRPPRFPGSPGFSRKKNRARPIANADPRSAFQRLGVSAFAVSVHPGTFVHQTASKDCEALPSAATCRTAAGRAPRWAHPNGEFTDYRPQTWRAPRPPRGYD